MWDLPLSTCGEGQLTGSPFDRFAPMRGRPGGRVANLARQRDMGPEGPSLGFEALVSQCLLKLLGEMQQFWAGGGRPAPQHLRTGEVPDPVDSQRHRSGHQGVGRSLGAGQCIGAQ